MEIKLEGVRQLTRQINAVSPQLRKELGQRNKGIGQRIIDKAFPKPEQVGAGTGAKPRPSASANVLRIMAGGAHRTGEVPRMQWGARFVPREEKRPYIARSAEVNMPEIERDYLDALGEVARKAGLRFERR